MAILVVLVKVVFVIIIVVMIIDALLSRYHQTIQVLKAEEKKNREEKDGIIWRKKVFC